MTQPLPRAGRYRSSIVRVQAVISMKEQKEPEQLYQLHQYKQQLLQDYKCRTSIKQNFTHG